MIRRSDDDIIVVVGIQLSKATIMNDVAHILSAINQGDLPRRAGIALHSQQLGRFGAKPRIGFVGVSCLV